MSALGQKQTYAPQKPMSALPLKADMCSALRDVCFGPIADIGFVVSTSIPTGDGTSPTATRSGRLCGLGCLVDLVGTEWSRPNNISFMGRESAHRHLQVMCFLFHADPAQFTNQFRPFFRLLLTTNHLLVTCLFHCHS